MVNKSLFLLLIFSYIELNSAISLANVDVKKCKKRNGNFPMEGSACRAYYSCTNFQPRAMKCPGNMHFHEGKALCVIPEMFPCFEEPKSKECPQDNGKFLKPGTMCKVYYDCCGGKYTLKKCYGELLFDPESGRCQYPEYYTCPEATTKSTVKSSSTRHDSSDESSSDSSENKSTKKLSTASLVTSSDSSEESKESRETTSSSEEESKTSKIALSSTNPYKTSSFQTVQPSSSETEFYSSSQTGDGAFSDSIQSSLSTSSNFSELTTRSNLLSTSEHSKFSISSDLFTINVTAPNDGSSSSSSEGMTKDLDISTLDADFSTYKLTDDGISTMSIESLLSTNSDIPEMTTRNKHSSTSKNLIYSTTKDISAKHTTDYNGSFDSSTSSVTATNNEILIVSTTEDLLSSQSPFSDNTDYFSTSTDDKTLETTDFTTSTKKLTAEVTTDLSTKDDLLSSQSSSYDTDSGSSNSVPIIFNTSETIVSTAVTDEQINDLSTTEDLMASQSFIPTTITNENINEYSTTEDLLSTQSFISTTLTDAEINKYSTTEDLLLTKSISITVTAEEDKGFSSQSSISDGDITTFSTSAGISSETKDLIAETKQTTGEDIRTFSTDISLSSQSFISDGDDSDATSSIKTKITDISTFTIETDETTEFVTLDIFCPEPNGYFPHPNDRHKFIGCVGGNPQIMDCPSNLVYNHKKRSCLYDTMKIYSHIS